jgi:hypothetical protein
MSNTEQTPTPETPQDAPETAPTSSGTPEAPEPVQDAPAAAPEPAEGNKANREAAKYRTQLRAAEADRDAAQATTARLRAAILDNALAAHGITPAAYRAVTADPEAVIGEDGAVDAETLAANAKAARTALGITTPRPSSSALARVNGSASLSPGRGWGEVLNG